MPASAIFSLCIAPAPSRRYIACLATSCLIIGIHHAFPGISSAWAASCLRNLHSPTLCICWRYQMPVRETNSTSLVCPVGLKDDPDAV